MVETIKSNNGWCFKLEGKFGHLKQEQAWADTLRRVTYIEHTFVYNISVGGYVNLQKTRCEKHFI